ncbi:alpha/beta fold hydrolase [Nocardia sp. CA-128927]|uniref:alpha/beta fold hydrolase n=1 Tax=Nocardia sp. CA-128927 TaxID=3239975 RepID=UPI003D966D49
MIICLNTVTPTQAYFHYAGFAAEFRDIRDVVVLSSPGFSAGEDLPETIEALAETMDTAIIDCAAGKSFILVGHSSGGWIGHAVTRFLEATGVPPAGLVLIDTRFIDTDDPNIVGGFMFTVADIGGNTIRLTMLRCRHSVTIWICSEAGASRVGDSSTDDRLHGTCDQPR